MLAAACACGGAFLLVLVASYYIGPARWIDGAALDGFESLDGRRLESIGGHLAHICNPEPFALIALAALTRGLRHAAAAAVLLGGANLSSQVLKPELGHFRPITQFTHVIQQIPAASFPSGHATAAMSLALAAILVAPRAYRPLVAVIGGLFTLGVSFSIVAMGWHFPSDIAGGFLVAAGWGFLALAGLRAAAIRWPEHGTMRKAARDAIAAPSASTLARAGLAVAAIGALVAATRAGQIAGFADRHTTAVAVASLLAVGAGALLAAITAVSDRPR